MRTQQNTYTRSNSRPYDAIFWMNADNDTCLLKWSHIWSSPMDSGRFPTHKYLVSRTIVCLVKRKQHFNWKRQLIEGVVAPFTLPSPFSSSSLTAQRKGRLQDGLRWRHPLRMCIKPTANSCIFTMDRAGSKNRYYHTMCTVHSTGWGSLAIEIAYRTFCRVRGHTIRHTRVFVHHVRVAHWIMIHGKAHIKVEPKQSEEWDGWSPMAIWPTCELDFQSD